MSQERVENALREWARAQLDTAPEVAVPSAPARARRPRRVWLPVAASVVAAVALAVTVVSVRADRPDGPSTGPDRSSRPSDPHLVVSGQAAAAVVHDGDTVTLDSTVIGKPGGEVRACYPAPSATFASNSTDSDPFSNCKVFVRLENVDLGKLAHARTSRGVVSGSATLVGTYHHGTVVVARQGRPATRGSVFDDTVPCAAPPGGWPHNDQSMSLIDAAGAYRRVHPGSVVEIAFLNPSSTQHVVYVLTTGDPAPVQAALDNGKHELCVVRSDYTPRQLQHARDVMRGEVGGTGLTSVAEGGGYGLSETEQPSAPIGVPMMSEQLARLIDEQPAGLVQADVWLVPVRR